MLRDSFMDPPRDGLGAARCCGCVPCPYCALGLRLERGEGGIVRRHRTWCGRLLALLQPCVVADLFGDVMHSQMLAGALLTRLLLLLLVMFYLEESGLVGCMARDTTFSETTDPFALVDPRGSPTTTLYVVLHLLS